MLLYRDVQEHASVCARFLRSAATVRSAILIAGVRRNLAGLTSGLVDVAGRVWTVDLTEAGADPGRVLSMIRAFARDHADDPVLIVQDVGWLGKPGDELAEAIRYEALLRAALAGSPSQVLCCYDARLDPGLVAAAERAHPSMLDQAGGRTGESFAGSGAASSLPAQLLSAPPAHARAMVFRHDQVGARRFAEAQARQAGLPASRIADLVIAVGEVAGNTLRHTAGQGTLTIWATEDELICQVDDRGFISDPLVGTLRPDPSVADSRRGLWLVHQIADLVQTRTGPSGTIMRLHLRLSQNQPRDRPRILRLPRPRDSVGTDFDATMGFTPSESP